MITEPSNIAVCCQIARLDIEKIRANSAYVSGLWATKTTCFGTTTKGQEEKLGQVVSICRISVLQGFVFTTRDQSYTSTPMCCSCLTGIVDGTDP